MGKCHEGRVRGGRASSAKLQIQGTLGKDHAEGLANSAQKMLRVVFVCFFKV